jgi:hypothetical protein
MEKQTNLYKTFVVETENIKLGRMSSKLDGNENITP